PILCRYPADVFWQTGRRSLEPGSEDARSIGRLVDRYGVAYLLVEDRPYSNAAADPLARFVSEQAGRVRRVWGKPGAVIVYEIVSPSTRRASAQAPGAWDSPSLRRSPSRRVTPTRSRYSPIGTANLRVVPRRSRSSAIVRLEPSA